MKSKSCSGYGSTTNLGAGARARSNNPTSTEGALWGQTTFVPKSSTYASKSESTSGLVARSQTAGPECWQARQASANRLGPPTAAVGEVAGASRPDVGRRRAGLGGAAKKAKGYHLDLVKIAVASTTSPRPFHKGTAIVRSTLQAITGDTWVP